MRPAIEAIRLGKRYRAVWALHDCTLNIPVGRITALIGPNGAGKTTFLKLAAGLLAPDMGDIETLGWSPQRQPSLVLARVGYVPQDRPLYPRFTVAEMLHLGRALNPRWDDRAAHVRIQKHGIDIDRQIRTLSGGQHAQVSLALALGKRPDLLLLDEPASALDPLARRDFLAELLDAVAATGISVLLSSHLIADIERVCDYVVILSSGQVQMVGDIDAVREEHTLIIGPRINASAVANDPTVISARHTDRETALLVRQPHPAAPPGWRSEPVTLEELVLAYLENPGAAAFPSPTIVEPVAR